MFKTTVGTNFLASLEEYRLLIYRLFKRLFSLNVPIQQLIYYFKTYAAIALLLS